ncbi:hypothetical protein PHET_03112 [Paragonimus heterotremus]|uniref:UBX domain-containing protein n=1 Tax=Paragonimus heterotremus TaxID=100268 RepID=A0A8J4SRN5_9TREM|nr:hypothetical protein PHET_03112 [Paragonimus heterotremus]
MTLGLNGTRERATSKRGHLRQLFQPPTEILFRGSLSEALATARNKKQWLLLSLHDEGCFDCHLLNRDVWKDPRIFQTIKRNFTFIQIPVDSPEGIRYRGEHAYVNSASHIAILDPVTGEQKVMWMHLKDPKSVHEVLTDFLRHSTLNSTDHVEQPTAINLDSTISTPSFALSRTRRLSDACSSTYPLKRPRLDQSVSDSSDLSSRVAAVSSQIAEGRVNSDPSSGTNQPEHVIHQPNCRLSVDDRLLDLTEEQQIQLAIEASKVESSGPSRSHDIDPHNDLNATTDPVDDLIVLTDDDDEDVDDSDDDNTDPDCFIFDPDATHPPSRSSTAIISSRRPLRPTGTACVTSSASVQPPVCQADPRHTEEVDLEFYPLPVPKLNEEAVELVVRLPNGTREVLRLTPSLPLVDLRCYFESRGFPRSRYELVRLYPRCSLSSFSESTTLSEAGLARKDTIFIQER